MIEAALLEGVGGICMDEGRINLTVVAGREAGEFSFTPQEAPVRIGRLSTSACRLDDPTVSRRHAILEWSDGRWRLTDTGSRSGTAVNGQRIDHATALAPGDEIGIGSWRLQVRRAEMRPTTIAVSGALTQESQVRLAPRRVSHPLAVERLSLLLEFAGGLQDLSTERELAGELLRTACRGAAFSDGAVLSETRGAGDQAEALATQGELDVISRTVLERARDGQVVQLQDSPDLSSVHSLVAAGVRDVLCVPLQEGIATRGFLYLIRQETGAASDADDAADFCVALVRLAEVALLGLRRRELEKQIGAARAAQERLLPSVEGRARGLRYAMLSRPGRGVAGDLFDVIEFGEHRSAVLLGDVTGKGVGAGLVMSAAQAFLNGALQSERTLLQTVEELNQYLIDRSLTGEFVTLWIGVYDAQTRELEYVDAGHGFAALTPTSGEATLLQEGGGPPLGLESGALWASARRLVNPGDRLLLFSDGLVEQQSPRGEEFGLPAAVAAFREHRNVREAVAGLVAAGESHAQGAPFADDLTIACLEFD